ncbi:hypothetical protein [Paenibacillus sp. SAF-054]
MDIIDFLIVRINRGCSIEQAIAEVSKMNYPVGIEVGMKLTESPYPLELVQLKEYYDGSSIYLFLLLECLRVMRPWEPYKIADALIVLKNWIGYNNEHKDDYTPQTVFGFMEKNKPGTLARRAKEILFDKIDGVSSNQYKI